MTSAEKTELLLLAPAVLAVGFWGDHLPDRLTVGELLTVACAAWLVQGGVRDLGFLWRLRRHPPAAPPRRLTCMCLESTAGLAGILAGVVLALAGIGGTVALSPLRWLLVAGGVFLGGFLLKDWIITWRPLGLRRDPEHHAIVFVWGRRGDQAKSVRSSNQ